VAGKAKISQLQNSIARMLIIVVAMGILAGCGGSLPSTELPSGREVAPALEFPGLRDYRGIVDCKMRASGFDQSKLAELAGSAQLDFVFLGDEAKPGSSDFGIGGFSGDVLFFPGAAYKIGDSGAEIVALNLQRPVDPSRDLIAQIHDQGGLALASNLAAFSSSDDYALADLVEIYNLDRAWHQRNAASLYFHAVFFGADHFFANLDEVSDDAIIYDRNSGARMGLVAGVGAAPNKNVMGTKVGTYEQIFELTTTHIIATERQADPIVDALRHGHAYVVFDFLGYVPNFMFFAQAGDHKVMMGDEVPMTASPKLKVEMPAQADKVVLVDNGSELETATNVSTFEYTPTAPGVYRIEAYRRGHPWIYSNPIYVR